MSPKILLSDIIVNLVPKAQIEACSFWETSSLEQHIILLDDQFSRFSRRVKNPPGKGT
jgi:hypothetical protein